MPTVAIVEGVKVQFFAEEHPRPHFHAQFPEHRVQNEISSLRVLKARLPPAKLSVVIKWAGSRREEPLRTWRVLLAKQKLEKIK
jgi:Domain of unknown function (DUF4160)